MTGDAEDSGQKKATPPPPVAVPADWYPDPDSPRTLQRYWDGESWTDDTAPLPATESTTAIEGENLAPIPAGWYTDPDEPANRRYWDGEEWTDWTDKTYEKNLNRDKDSRNDTLVVIGWITAVLIPIVGLVLGIVVATRGDKRGTWVIVASVVVFLISLVILSATGN